MRKRILTKLVGVLLSDDDHSKLIELTDKLEVSNSEYLRGIIINDLTNQEKEKMEK